MQFLNLIRKNNYLPVYLFIILSANIYLQFVPLTKYFSFEFSFINAILLTFLSGIYFILVYKKLNEGSKKLLLQKFTLAYILFLILPAFISIIHSFFSANCPITHGASFYLVITFPSVIVGASLGIISVNTYKHFQLLIFLLLFLIILSIPFFEFYFNPQIYFYNPIFAFFPGTIYDENVSLNLRLVIYRIINIIFFGTIVFIFFRTNILSTKLKRAILLTSLILISAAFVYFSSDLNFSTSFSKLNRELNNKVETQHFIIHFPPQIDDDLKKSLCLTHEYYYSQLEKNLGVKEKRKINSYIFESNEEKKELIGTANADISKPWLKCSFITLNDYKETLQHELAHCMSSNFGVGILKVSYELNPALIEGIAVSSSPFYDEHSIYYMAGLAYKNGYKVNLQNLFNGYSFYTNASSISYVYAGSFSKYLIDNYGIDKYKKYYSSNKFYSSFDLPFLNVQNKFYDFLDSLNISHSSDEAYYYYGYNSIFYKYCPRYIAEQIKAGWQLYNNKKYYSALWFFKYIDNQTNNYSSLIGLADCYLKENNSIEAIKSLKQKISKFKGTGYFYNIEMKLADIYAISGLSTEADSIYEKIIQKNPNYYFISAAKIRLALNNDPVKLKVYLDGSNFDRFLILKHMNENEYNYYSIPVIIELSSHLNININLIKKIFSRSFETKNFPEVFAVYKMSEYFFEHLEFNSALELANLAVKSNHNWDYDSILKENYNKINWSYSNNTYIFNNIKSNHSF